MEMPTAEVLNLCDTTTYKNELGDPPGTNKTDLIGIGDGQVRDCYCYLFI